MPTFTRSTTATFVDFEGAVRTAKAGEARFQGARRVENLLPNSGGVWGYTLYGAVTPTTGQLDPNGGTTGIKLSGAGNWAWGQQISGVLAGSKCLGSLLLRADSAGVVDLQLYDGATVTTLSVPITTTWTLVSNSHTIAANISRFALAKTSSQAVYVAFPQLENVTGQSVQTPGEYVSTGVLNYPFHGAGVDGVKYFSTKLDGSPCADTGAAVLGFLTEGSRTNSTRNSSMAGAVVGTPGTLPTNWVQSVGTGLSWSVAGTGVDAGLAYVDLRLSGVSVGNTVNTIRFDSVNAIAAAAAQVWTNSLYLKLVSGSLANVSASKVVMGQSTDGSGIQSAPAVAILTVASAGVLSTLRSSVAATMTTGAAYLAPYLQIETTLGTVDLTLRIAAPQTELGASASSYITTTSAAVTRASDSDTTPVTPTTARGAMVLSLTATGAAGQSQYPGVCLRSSPVTLIGFYVTPSLSQINIFIKNANAIALEAFAATPVAGAKIKFGVSWANGRVACCVNGASPTVYTGIAVPVGLTTFDASALDNNWFGTDTDAKIYRTTLSDAQLQALTA